MTGLTWDCVRLNEGDLLISKPLRGDGTATHQRLWSGTKTGKARVVPLSHQVVQVIMSLLKNPAVSAKMGQLPSPDARSAGAQRLPVLLRVDRGADPGQPSAAADPQAGGSGPRSPQSHLLQALRRRRPAIGAARAPVAGLVVAGVLWDPLGAAFAGAAPRQPAVPLVCGIEPG